MRITEAQLRQIIRQEVRALRESDHDDWSAPEPGALEMMELAGEATIRSNRGDTPRQVFNLMMAGLKKIGVDPYDGLPEIISHIRRAEGLSSFADQLEELALNRGF
jgi:hypothetical protein